MNGMLTRKAPPYSQEELERIRSHRLRRPVRLVSSDQKEQYGPQDALYHVVVWDFGAKQNIVRELTERGCRVTAVSYTHLDVYKRQEHADAVGSFLSQGYSA